MMEITHDLIRDTRALNITLEELYLLYCKFSPMMTTTGLPTRTYTSLREKELFNLRNEITDKGHEVLRKLAGHIEGLQVNLDAKWAEHFDKF